MGWGAAWLLGAAAALGADDARGPVADAVAPGAPSALEARGRRLYEDGIRVEGVPLVGRWPGSAVRRGADAACAQCHRPSGMGSAEGSAIVPAITGRSLFTPLGEGLVGASPRRAGSLVFQDRPHFARPPYDAARLADALARGVDPSGRSLSPVMPRYELSEADLQALVAWLWRLSPREVPGYTAEAIDFGTVFTPAADRLARQGIVDVLRACFDERFPPGRDGAPAWRLHVWDLHGPARTWGTQLAAAARAQPVFALVSGAGAADWAPVHQHCEAHRLPCLFPQVDAPGDVRPGRSTFYLSGGVAAEGAVVARALAGAADGPAVRRWLQVRATGDAVAAAGARALRAALPVAVQVDERVVDPGSSASWRRAVRGLRAGDAVMLWLRPQALEAFVRAVPAPVNGVRWAHSGWLALPEAQALTPTWRETLMATYPLDPPARRERRLRFNLEPWLAGRSIAPAPPTVLGNALAACNLLTEGMMGLRGVASQAWLVEQIEAYPAAMGNAPAPQAYPHFNLGPGRRIAAHGAYLVRYGPEPGAAGLRPVGEWIAP